MPGPKYKSEVEQTGTAMGWMPDPPDIRDYTPYSVEVQPLFQAAKLFDDEDVGPSSALDVVTMSKGLPESQDLRRWCSPIENQGGLGSCTANAGVGLMEYYERRTTGNHLDASRLFVYKTTRKLLGWTGDTGAYLRVTMQAMALFGAPPEKHYPYVITDFDLEPLAYHYAMAQNYQSLRYYRLDSVNLTKNELLLRLKCFLRAGLPFMFGFSVYNFGNDEGEFHYPRPGERRRGGHAIVGVGYDDNRVIEGRKGALLIRNSWGTGWGDKGYGWLPYDYILNGLSADFWSLFKMEYLDLNPFYKK